MSGLLEILRKKSASQSNNFNLNDELLTKALDFLDEKKDILLTLKDKVQRDSDFHELIEPLIDLEKKQNCISQWRVVLDFATNDGKYISNPIIQFCSGPPNYDRLIILFEKGTGVSIYIDNTCVEEKPDLSKVCTQFSPDKKQLSLKQVKQYYDKSGVQRIALLGSARVFPYTKPIDPYDLSKGFDEPTENTKWARNYIGHVEKQINKLFDYLEEKNVLFTTVNGGWAGRKENSMGVPMVSHLFGIVHEHDDGNTFPPVTIMPTSGQFDRVVTRGEIYDQGKIGKKMPNISVYFAVPGTWGDDSKYLAGFSSSLIVFEPYGYWTNIEIANGVVQNKPVVIIAAPINYLEGGKYYDEFKQGAIYIEKQINLSNAEIGSYRIYKDAAEAANWINECFVINLSKSSLNEKKLALKAPLITQFSSLYLNKQHETPGNEVSASIGCRRR